MEEELDASEIKAYLDTVLILGATVMMAVMMAATSRSRQRH